MGKTGMFEFQPEEWTDVNENIEEEDDEESIVRTIYVAVHRILVPTCVPFVLDYCFLV